MTARAFGPRSTLCCGLAWLLALGACTPSERAPELDGPGREPLVRPDTPGNALLFRFEDDDVVETLASPGGSFLVHYTRDGVNAVPSADSDTSGVPDFVEQVATVYDEVLAAYQTELGFRPPLGDDFITDNGGDGRFDVYLVDFDHVGDGNFQSDQCTVGNDEVCAGYMVQENDYAGYGYPSTLTANRILGSHELFHAVQAAYDTGQGSVLAEGTAVWATEQLYPSLSDFEALVPGYLQNPDRSLDEPLPGPADPFSYGAAIFFQFLEERYGAGTVRALLERCEDGAFGVDEPSWFTALDPLLQAEAGTSFAEAFVQFATYNLMTGLYADPDRSYAHAGSYGRVLFTDVAAPYVDELMRVYHASAQYYSLEPAGRAAMTAALVVPEGSEAELDGMVLLQSTQLDTDVGEVVRLVDPTAATELTPTDGVQRFLVVVVNTLQAGDSQRPGLCIGSADEVATCREAILAGAGGAGGEGGTGGAGGAEPPGDDATGDDAGCGCRLVRAQRALGQPRAPRRSPAWLGAVGALGLVVARRGRRS